MGHFSNDGREQGLDGDKTTTGATCFSSLPQASLEDGRGALRLGDKTSLCGLCGQIGVIAEGDSCFTWDGIPTALHNALVKCGCPLGTNRLISPSRTTAAEGKASVPAAERNASQAPQALVPTPTALHPHVENVPQAAQAQKTFARTFIATDSENGQPLANRTFTATVDGRQVTGDTDSSGLVRVEAPSADSRISIHIAFRSPVRELCELAGMTTRSVTTTTRVEQLLHGELPAPIAITVNDRAGTREAIIQKVRELGNGFVERSEWHAEQPKKPLTRDWDYSMIALHNAGRSYSCGQGSEQMTDTQDLHTGKGFDDIGYHFGIDCSGVVYEGRDIRFKGEHLMLYNSNAIGIVLLNNLSTHEEGGDFVAWARTALHRFGFNTTKPVPDLQASATINLIMALKDVFHINQFGGHREFPRQTSTEGKMCPGNIGMKLARAIRAKTRLKKPS
jgi:uncharacterized Zn-binding protein involved in type VI secretion